MAGVRRGRILRPMLPAPAPALDRGDDKSRNAELPTLLEWIDRSEIHVSGRCFHRVQFEHAARFAKLLFGFFSEAQP